MLGGMSIIVLLLANLLAAHILRFKLNWKRSGVLLIHAGLILLLVGEIVTAAMAVESRMTIAEGQTIQYRRTSARSSWPSSTRPTRRPTASRSSPPGS
jgi:cytochrome c biogenesis factor